MSDSTVESRARRYAALADPARLMIVDELVAADRSPVELRRLVGIESNLLSHHLDVLESGGTDPTLAIEPATDDDARCTSYARRSKDLRPGHDVRRAGTVRLYPQLGS